MMTQHIILRAKNRLNRRGASLRAGTESSQSVSTSAVSASLRFSLFAALAVFAVTFCAASAGVAERFSPELLPLLLPDAEDSADLAVRMLRWRRDVTGWKRRIESTMRSLRAYTWDDMAAQIVCNAEDTNIHGGCPRRVVNSKNGSGSGAADASARPLRSPGLVR